MLIRGAEFGSARADIRLADGKIACIAPHILPQAGDEIVEAAGRTLLPGLHDHHIHLMSLAASLESVFCGPPAVATEAALIARLRANAGEGWLRGIGYHESVAGEITRAWLDRALPNRPARIQHRSGRLWIFNSVALDLLEAADAPFGAMGHLYDGDDWLRTRLRSAPPDLARGGALLASYGVTGVTDTSFRNGPEQFEILRAAHDTGALPQDVCIMGLPSLDAVRESPGVMRGEVKFHLHDHDHPAPDALRDAFRAAHDSGRAVAVHCVTLADLVLTLNALEEAGPRAGDRIEHASICPPDFYAQIKALDWGLIDAIIS